jgi:hypothetical protein
MIFPYISDAYIDTTTGDMYQASTGQINTRLDMALSLVGDRAVGKWFIRMGQGLGPRYLCGTAQEGFAHYTFRKDPTPQQIKQAKLYFGSRDEAYYVAEYRSLKLMERDDEPTTYDTERWGKPSVGTVYKTHMGYIIIKDIEGKHCVGFKYSSGEALPFCASREGVAKEVALHRVAFGTEVKQVNKMRLMLKNNC